MLELSYCSDVSRLDKHNNTRPLEQKADGLVEHGMFNLGSAKIGRPRNS